MNKKSFFSVKLITFLALPALLLCAVMWRAGDASAQRERLSNVAAKESADAEVLAKFDEWAKRFLNENEQSAEFIEQGAELAAQRRALFAELIRTNPRRAVESAIAANVRGKMPEPVAALLERRISATGDLTLTAFDDFDSEGGEHTTIERAAVFGDARYQAFVYGRKSAMTTKLAAPIRGVVLDDLIAVDENSVERIEPSEFAARGVEISKINQNGGVAAEAGGEIKYFSSESEYAAYVRELEIWESKNQPHREALSPWTEGQKNLLFIRVDFSDRPGVPVDRNGFVLTPEYSQALFDGPVNDFYFSNSYKKTSLRTTVTPVVRMPQPMSAYPQNNLNQLVNDARNAARAAGFETNNFDLDMVAFAQSPLLAWSGISPIGYKGALINGNFTFKVITHELGHAYGLLHANLWRSLDGTPNGSGGNVEYGDDFDMMGRGNTQATHYNANYKRSLDWLKEENVQTVTRSGVYRVFHQDTTAPNPQGIRALKIKKDAAQDYWVEFRQLLTNYPNVMDGAQIRWDYPENAWRETQILDMNPQTTQLDDSPLNIGQTYTDAASGIKITVLGKGGTTPESLDIKVEFNFSIHKGAPFDFDGDNKSDIGVFRPSNAVWYLNNSANGFSAFRYGVETDKPVPAKFDGDRKTDVAVFRDGTWYVQNSGGGGFALQFGLAGDVPVPADFDGDGYAELAVFRPSNGAWYMWNWVFQRFTAVSFGLTGDVPTPADFDGDGKTDIAVFRPTEGVWYIRQANGEYASAQFGLAGDVPVAADYDGDGRADIAVYRPSNGVWYLLQSTAGFSAAAWGLSSDIPAPADYDGDGKTDLTVFRPSEGVWYRLNSSNGAFVPANFGLNGDVPVSRGFAP